MHELLHLYYTITGANNESGPAYGFWSGFGGSIPDFLIISSIIIFLIHKNCHIKGCKRLGHPNQHGIVYCKRHNPMRHTIGRPL